MFYNLFVEKKHTCVVFQATIKAQGGLCTALIVDFYIVIAGDMAGVSLCLLLDICLNKW